MNDGLPLQRALVVSQLGRSLGPFLTKKNRRIAGSRIAKNVDPRSGFIPHKKNVSKNLVLPSLMAGHASGFEIQFSVISGKLSPVLSVTFLLFERAPHRAPHRAPQ